MKLKDYSLKYFERRYKKEKDSKLKQRLHILLLLREGYTEREVSSILHLSTGKVPFWKKRFGEEGVNGLKDKPGRGVKSKILDEELSMLRSSMEEPIPTADGYSRGWNSKDIRIFIKDNFGLAYTRQHICRLLHKIRCSLQVPRPRSKKRNQREVDKFKREFKKNEKYWVPT